MAKKFPKRERKTQASVLTVGATKHLRGLDLAREIASLLTPADLEAEEPEASRLHVEWTSAPRIYRRGDDLVADTAGMLILEKWERPCYLTTGEALALLQYLLAKEATLLNWLAREGNASQAQIIERKPGVSA